MRDHLVYVRVDGLRILIDHVCRNFVYIIQLDIRSPIALHICGDLRVDHFLILLIRINVVLHMYAVSRAAAESHVVYDIRNNEGNRMGSGQVGVVIPVGIAVIMLDSEVRLCVVILFECIRKDSILCSSSQYAVKVYGIRRGTGILSVDRRSFEKDRRKAAQGEACLIRLAVYSLYFFIAEVLDRQIVRSFRRLVLFFGFIGQRKMHHFEDVVVINADLFQLVLLKFNVDLNRTVFRLKFDLFARHHIALVVSLVDHERNIIYQRIIFRERLIRGDLVSLLRVLQRIVEIPGSFLGCLFIDKFHIGVIAVALCVGCDLCHLENSIIRNGIRILQCCRYLDLTVFIGIHPLDIDPFITKSEHSLLCRFDLFCVSQKTELPASVFRRSDDSRVDGPVIDLGTDILVALDGDRCCGRIRQVQLRVKSRK